MQAITTEVIVNLLLIPVIVFAIQRLVGRHLDKYDDRHRELEERERGVTEREEAETSLILAMARSMLLDNYEKCANKGFYSVEEREVYSKLYEAYKTDGGNSVIDALAPRIRELPLEPPRRKE